MRVPLNIRARSLGDLPYVNRNILILCSNSSLCILTVDGLGAVAGVLAIFNIILFYSGLILKRTVIC